MYATATTTDSARELAYRESGGLEVTLLWDEGTDALWVSVLDGRDLECFAFEPPRDRALAAFYHPFAYARRLPSEFALVT